MYDEFDRQPGERPSEWLGRLWRVDRAGLRLHRLMALHHLIGRAKALMVQQPYGPELSLVRQQDAGWHNA